MSASSTFSRCISIYSVRVGPVRAKARSSSMRSVPSRRLLRRLLPCLRNNSETGYRRSARGRKDNHSLECPRHRCYRRETILRRSLAKRMYRGGRDWAAERCNRRMYHSDLQELKRDSTSVGMSTPGLEPAIRSTASYSTTDYSRRRARTRANTPMTYLCGKMCQREGCFLWQDQG